MTPGKPLRAAVLWLAGIDLRLTLLAIPPVIPLIHRDLRLSESGIAALSNLPVLVLAGSSVFGALLTARLGARGALVAGLLVIALAGALRGAGPSIPMLFAMTLCMGAGIAVIQPAFPSLARGWFPDRIALGTSIWANGLLCGEALSASLTLPFMLPLAGGSWERALAYWSVPVAVTALIVAAVPDDAAAPPPARWMPNFRDPRVWQLGTFQAAASLTYFGANTFVPDYLNATGQPQFIAACLAGINVGQIPASLAVGVLPMRLLGSRATLAGTAAAMLVALGVFLRPGGAAAVAASAVLGAACAYILTMSFAWPALLSPHAEVPRIAAGTFTLGYALSFIATLASGIAWDATHVPATAFLPIVSAAAIVVLAGGRLSEAERATASP